MLAAVHTSTSLGSHTIASLSSHTSPLLPGPEDTERVERRVQRERVDAGIRGEGGGGRERPQEQGEPGEAPHQEVSGCRCAVA